MRVRAAESCCFQHFPWWPRLARTGACDGLKKGSAARRSPGRGGRQAGEPGSSPPQSCSIPCLDELGSRGRPGTRCQQHPETQRSPPSDHRLDQRSLQLRLLPAPWLVQEASCWGLWVDSSGLGTPAVTFRMCANKNTPPSPREDEPQLSLDSQRDFQLPRRM